jgi:hypothetical protein
VIRLQHGRRLCLSQRAVHLVAEGPPNPLRPTGGHAQIVCQDLSLSFSLDLGGCNGGQDSGDHATYVGGHVDVSGGGDQTDLPFQCPINEELQILHRTGHPVQMPGDNEVRLAGFDHLDETLPTGSIRETGSGSRDSVVDDADHVPSPGQSERATRLFLAPDLPLPRSCPCSCVGRALRVTPLGSTTRLASRGV